MKNKKFINREYSKSGNLTVASKRGLWRAVSICLLFAAIVFSSVFGVTGLFGSRGQNLAGESSVAYADNKSNHDKWLAAINKSVAEGSQETVKLDSNWIAEVKEKDATDTYANGRKRTEFGTESPAFVYNRATNERSDSSGALNVPSGANIVLDLNGFKLDRNLQDETNGLGLSMPNGYVITIAAGGQLTLKDSKGGGMITGGWNNTNSNGSWAGAINVNDNATFIMESGVITKNWAYGAGGVATNGRNSKFIMNGGKITENESYSYYGDYRSVGGVMNYNGLFEMHGTAEISNNVGMIGGLSHYTTGAQSYMYDSAKIVNNRSYASHDQMVADTAKNGKTNTSTSTYSVGGVWLHSSCGLEMNDSATVSNNTGLAGGIAMSSSDWLTMNNNSSVKDNVGTSYENTYSTGGISLTSSSNTILLNNSATVSGNNGRVGGINFCGSSNNVTMNATSSVKSNKSEVEAGDQRASGGIYVNSGCTLTMNDTATVSNNTAGWDDVNKTNLPYGTGGITYYGTVVINDKASVKDNVGMGYVRGAGGLASWDSYGALYLRGGIITGNRGYTSGGVFKYHHNSYNVLCVAYDPFVKNNVIADTPDTTKTEANDIDLSYRRIYGEANDFRTHTDSRNNVITIEAGLEDGAEIGVVKYTSNYTTGVEAVFTKNYYINNATEDPSNFFFPSLGSSWFDVTIRIPPNGAAEAGFVSKVDIQNWQYAVIASTSINDPKTVKLYHDITAKDFNGTTDKQFYGMYYNDPTGFANGALHVPAGKSIILDLNGHTIDRNLSEAIYMGYTIYNLGTLEIIDTSNKTGVITGGKSTAPDTRNITQGYGGGIYNAGTLTLSGGSIQGNEAINGAGIYHVTGKLYIKGGTIKNNVAKQFTGLETTTGMGGGIHGTNPCEITVTGGTITGNEAAYGGGIYMYAQDTTKAAGIKLKVQGGTITKNSATKEGGGIGIYQLNTYFGMRNAPVIKDNTVNGEDNDIHLPSAVLNGAVGFDNGIITIEAPLTGSKDNAYGVYRFLGYTFTKNFNTYNKENVPSDFFYAQREDFKVQTSEDGKEGELISEHGYDNWYSAVVLSRINGNRNYTVKLTEDWTAVRNTSANFNTSLYGDRLKDSDVSGSGAYFYGSMNVPASTTITLDLNGHTINRGLTTGYAGSMWGMVISVSGGTLIIEDNSEDGDGKITGGWIQNSGNAYYGGGITLHNDASRLQMYGGTICENRSTGYYNNTTPTGVGGVGLITKDAQFTMLGGSITNNIGTFAGGVGFHTLKSGTFNVGGSAVIADNGLGNFSTPFGKGTPNDVHNPGATAGTTEAHALDQNTYKIGVAGKFEKGARIGISRPDVNNVTFMNTNGNIFTQGYSMFNTDDDGNVIDPKTYFFASNSSQSEIRKYDILTGGVVSGCEATIWNVDAATNWSAAHAQGRAVTAAPITVTLQGDWVADEYGKMGYGDGFSAEGGLAMSKSNIVLDLNGYTIDRGLTNNAIDNGYVIYMSGTCRLEIVDYSEKKTGKIIGGNTLTVNQAGGINVASATSYLTIRGGTITGNKGDAGGVATFTSADFTGVNYFAMGDTALVTGNTNLDDEALNINLRGKYNQQIEILSELTAKGQSGITKDSSSDFTINYPAYHTDTPMAHFTNDSDFNYVIKSSSGEGALYTMDNYSNWVFAVNESYATRGQRTVMLVSDWVAPMTTGMFAKSTSETFAFFYGGALNVPSGVNIILDLNGYTLNRNLRVATDNGFVINVEQGGVLTIRDTYVAGEGDEQRVGTITGGYNRTTATDYVGGGINNRYILNIEGGVITGNYSITDVSYSSGGVYNDSHAGVKMTMTGGKITGNFGAFTGGLNVHTATNVYIGGSAVVRDNKLVGGKLSDIRPQGDAIGNRINIYSAFTKDAYVGVSYIGNNYNTDRNSRIFTNNFTTVNAGVNPSTVFHYADPLTYRVISLAPTAGSNAFEAAVECIDNEQNWRQAIEASSATVKQTVTLSRDWTASADNTNITSFGTNGNAYSDGGLYVPANRSVILDLNGYTINRGLTTAKTVGFVIYVNGGNLEITDSSAAKKGVITGGYSNDTAGGIHFNNGSLTLTGGKITGNIGTVGGVHINNAANLPFAMGGSAVVTGNTDTKFVDSNIVSNSPIQMINIVSTMNAKEKTCFERPGVGEFTTNFVNQNRGKDPSDFFTSVDPMYVFKAENGEGSIYTNDNATNWEYAIKSSIAGGKKQITFMLVDDWTAAGGVFGNTDPNAFTMDTGEGIGALYVPNTADIVLDLNGYTLNRGLANAISEGYVMRVLGNLKIIDSSKDGTGEITGGNNNYNGSTYGAQSGAIYMYDGARVIIEGGTITGNIAKGNFSSAITLGRDERYIALTITGGTITGNYGGSTEANNNEGAGGILTMAANVLKLSGTPKIENNMHNGGYECNIRLQRADYYIQVVGEFKNGAHIGVAPQVQVDNWASTTTVGSQFTVNYSAHNKGVANTPDRYFFGKWVQDHQVRSTNTNNGVEGSLYCMENYVNWANAVYHSGATTPITFQLTKDWTATTDTQFGSMFSPTDRTTNFTSYYNYGAINLPYNRYVILDLAGYTIDRNLASGVTNGYTIYNRGRLEIIDSSKNKTGKIKGGYNTTGGGGIVTDGNNGGNNGLLLIQGGTITDNVGTEGAGIYVVSNAKLQLGGTTQIYGNYSIAGEASNVYLQSTAVGSENSMIRIVSAFTGSRANRQKIGVSRGSNGDVTLGFADNMSGDSPLDYFVSENSKYYGIESGEGEFFFLSPNNDINWEYAVTQSMNNKPAQTVRLAEDWDAGENSSYGTAFYTAAPTSNGIYNGALYVPQGASVILDLNGFAVNRNLKSAQRYGTVIIVLGKLTVIDSSEEGTGVITGGHIPSNYSDTYMYSGGVMVGWNNTKSRFDLLGGTIKENYYDAAGYAGGVYVYPGSTFNIEDAAVIENHNPTSGVFVANGAIMSASGKAVIENNGPTGSDIERDVVFGNNEAGVITVNGAFEDGAHIGVYKKVNNYHSLTFGGAKITVEYSRYNTKPVNTYFFSSDTPTYDIIELTGTGSKEVGLFCFDNTINWYNAANYSSAQTGVATVKLYSDWEAGTSSSNNTPLFNYLTNNNGGWSEAYNGNLNMTAFYQGALRVAGGKQIQLDLNGYKIDRKLTAANQYGYVILVEGSLSVVDTSAGGAGMITGGWTSGQKKEDIDIAAGIHVTGTFSLEGGLITANKGIGIYFTGNTPFSLGGKARVVGNQFDKGEEINIFMANKDQRINIISKFEEGAQFGVARAKGANYFGSGQLTNNYSKYNKKEEPTKYFVSDNKDFNIVSEGFFEQENMEAVIMGKNNVDNWAYAVQTSQANGGRAQTFTLSGDWRAADVNNGNTTDFAEGQSLTGYANGALYVPYGASIILDLNGHILDRHLLAPQANGEVIYVRGSLTVRDSSDTQTGKITGANTTDSYSNFHVSGVGWQYSQSYGAISVYLGSLTIEGGTITGNKNSGTVAGGVYISDGASFSMTGGKITGNSCYNPNDGTTVRGIGGVYADGKASVSIGGTAYIYENKYQDAAGSVLASSQSNLYLQNESNKVLVNAYFDDGAKVGLTVNSNQIAASGRFVTSGWQTLNNDHDASTVFVTDHKDLYIIKDYQQNGTHEAIMFCQDNQVNWMNTVQTSINTKTTQTFVLSKDWKADPIGNWWAASSFYAPNSNATGYYYGALYVPSNASVILDLNGYTIDRDLWKTTGYSSYGYVIIVNGYLQIIDSTATTDRNGKIKQGAITGGYGYDGGGIYANYGTLDVQAGLIHDNRVARYGAGIFDYQGAVSLGGTVQFYNNVHEGTNGASEDLMFYYSNYMLNISAPIVTGTDADYNNITVRRDKIGTFTTNWGKHNPTTKPESRFVAELANYRVYSSGTGAQREGVILANNNNDNWVFAVTTSLSTKSPERFTLVDENDKGGWLATDYNEGRYTTRFGTQSQSYRNGALLVPQGAKVVMDLNGLTLDRRHASQTDAQYATFNMVIIVEGELQIIDTSTGGTGKITGGSYGVFINQKDAKVTFGGIPLGDTVLTGEESNVFGSQTGGNITGNSINGVYVNYGTFSATGGSLIGNSQSGVLVAKNPDTTINVADSPVFFNNNTTTNPGIIMLDPEEKINITSALTEDARIGYMRQGVGQLTSGWGENQGNSSDPFKTIFLSQDPKEYSGTTDTFDGYTEITVSSFNSAVNWQATVDRSLSTGKQQEFTMYACWDAEENTTYTTAFGTTSAYKNGALYVPAGANVVLNLNGHTLNRNLKKAVGNGMVIYVDGELTIKSNQLADPASLVVNCCEKDKDGNRPIGHITGGNNNTGSSSAGLYVGKDGNVVLESGRFDNNIVNHESASATSSGGAVYVAGKFEMAGGQIDNNEGTSAGAVFVASSGTFEMSGGEIFENTGAYCGGVYTTGTFNFTNGVIKENEGGIGAVYVGSGGKFTMDEQDGSQTEILSNKGGSAGAIYVNNGLNTYFVMNGGYIADNEGISAGAIYAAGKVEIHGGYIRDNTSLGNEKDKTEGGGAIFVSSTGNVTINGNISNSFVDISKNVGINGIRVHSSGVLGVGGDVRIYENEAIDKNLSKDENIGENDYNNIYFVASTRKLDVVSAFAADATVGIYRPTTGIFTKGYGLYNSEHPEEYFVSDIAKYEIAFSEQDNVLENEAAIGLVVNPAPKALETAGTYDGTWQTIIKDIDRNKVSFDEDDLPEGVRVNEFADDHGCISIEAVNAGEYMITFDLKSGYCWSDGTTSHRGITGKIDKAVVNVIWSDCADSPCTYNGSAHEPTATADPNSLFTNAISGVQDECNILTSNGQRNFGNYTATATSGNGNYYVAEDDTYEFSIGKAERSRLAIDTAEAAYRTPTEIKYSNYEQDGTPTYKVLEGNAQFDADGKLVIKCKPGEKVKIELTLGESENYAAKTVTKEITCIRATLSADTELAFDEMEYLEKKDLALKEAYTGMTSQLGGISWDIENGYDGTSGNVLQNGNAITAQNVGKIRAIAHMEQSDYFEESDIYGVITIKQKLVTLDWFDDEGNDIRSVVYNGNDQTATAPKAFDKDNKEVKDIVSVYKAGFAGWDSNPPTGKQSPTWTNVGKYDIGVVLDANYRLASSDDYFTTFAITKATPNAQFVELEAYYNIPFTPAVEYVDGFGDANAKITITVDRPNCSSGMSYKSTANADGTVTYTATAKGNFAFTATIAESDNFTAATINVVYTVSEASMELGVRNTSTDGNLYYGDEDLQLIAYFVDINKNKIDLAYDESTIVLADGFEDYATVTSNDDLSQVLITVHKAGKINLVVTSLVDKDSYKASSDTIEIELKPKALGVDWSGYDENEGYIYNGLARHPSAEAASGLINGDTVTVEGYKAYEKVDGEYVEVEDGAVHVGTYYIIPVFSDENYAVYMDKAIEIEIKPLPVVLTWSNTNLTYNGDTQAPTATVSNILFDDECNVTVLGTKEASDSELTAKAYELDNDDYTLEDGVDITWGFYINPFEVEIEWGDTELTYNGLSQHPEYTIKGLFGEDECEAIISGAETNAGEDYTAIVTGLTNPNYKAPEGSGVVFSIASAELEASIKPVEVIYGSPVVLEVEGNAGNGRVTFKIVEGDDKATIGTGNLFTPTNVGEVKVKASIAATGNYDAIDIEQTITILPRPIEVGWSNLTFEYDGDDHNPTAKVTNAINGDELKLTLSAPVKNADTYTATVTGILNGDDETELKYTITGGKNIDQEFVIKPRVLEISWTNKTLTYNGDELAPTAVLENLVDGDECTFKVNGSVNAGTALRAEIDLETISNSNYTIDEDDSYTWFTVLPKLVRIEWGDTVLEYTGSEQHPTATAIGLVEGDECEINVSGGETNVGEDYTATATGVKNSNYTLVYDAETTPEEDRPITEITFSIIKADVEISLSGTEVVYGSTLNLTLDSNPGEATVTFAIKDNEDDTGEAEIDADVLTALGAGTVTVTVTLAGTDNYNGDSKDFTITIKQLPVEIEWTYEEYTYTGSEQKPTPSVVNALEGDTVNITEVSGNTNAGNDLVAEVKAIDNDNYTVVDGINITADYAILPKPITSITWDEDRVYTFNGKDQGPNATAGGLIEGEECEVTVSGWKTNVGNYTATVTGLKNPNYSLDLISDLTIDFKIEVSQPVIKIETTQVVVGTWEQIVISGNDGDGEVSFELVEGENYGELSGDMLYGKALGSVKVKVTVSATGNTNAAEVEGTISITKGQAPLDLERKTTTYGDKLELIPDDKNGALRDENGDFLFGEVSYSIDSRYSTIAEIVYEDGKAYLVAKGVTYDVVTEKDRPIVISMSIEGNDYYDETEVFLDITIQPRIVKIKWEGDTFTYNGKEQAPTATVTNLVKGDECEIIVVGEKNQGTYTAEAGELTNKNYTLVRATNTTKEYTIERAKVTIEWDESELQYTGEKQIPEAILTEIFGTDRVNPVYVIKDGKNPINVGSYVVTVSELEGDDADNYELDDEYEYAFDIDPADREPELDPVEIAYGTKVTLSITEASLIENADYTLTVLKNESVGAGTLTLEDGKYVFEATRVGKVKIAVSIDPSTNCNGYDGTLEITVVKAERETTITSLQGVYGEELELKIEGYDGDMSGVRFTLSKDDRANADIVWKAGADGTERWYLVPKHAAFVTVSVKVPETENYLDDEPTTAVIEIKQRIATLKWDNVNLVYNGSEQAPTASVSNLINNDECGVMIGSGNVDADSYSVTALSLTNSDYTLQGNTTTIYTAYTIDRAPITVTLKNTRVGADAPTKLVVNGNLGNAPVQFSVDNESMAKIEGDVLTPLQKGTVYVTIHVDRSRNYLEYTSQPILVVIDKSPLELSIIEDEVLYGDELTLEVTGNVENQAILFTVTNGSGKAEIISGNVLVAKGAGTVTVTATIAATANYALTVETFQITIKQRVVEIRWSDKNEFNYTGEDLFAPTARIVSGLINDDECEVIVEGGQLNVGKYAMGTAYASGLTNPNYKLEGDTRAPMFEVKKSALNIEFLTTFVTIKVPTEIKISGNKEFGETTFRLEPESTVATPLGEAMLIDNVITGTKLGFIHVTVTVAPTNNFDGGYAEIDIEIQKPAAPVDLVDKTVEYGQQLTLEIDKGVYVNEDGETVSADEGGTYSISLVEGKGSGSATLDGNVLTATGAGDVYILITVTATDTFKETNKEIKVTITPIVIKVEWTYPELTYNGEEQTPTATITNTINGDTYELEYSGSKDAGNNLTATITATGNPNYTVVGADVTTTYEIKPLPVVLSWDDTEIFTYNGKEQKPTAEITNLVEGDEAEVTVQGATNAGTQTATAISVDNPNYTVEDGTDIDHLFLINKLTVTVQWGDLELSYNGKTQVPVATAVGAVTGEEVHAVVTGTGKYVGTFTARATGVDNANYQLASQVTTDYTIKAAKVTFSQLTTEKEYTGENLSPDVAINKLDATDNVTVLVTDYTATKEVGDYNFKLMLTGAQANNYYVADEDKEMVFSITAKSVKIILTTKNVNAGYTGSAITLSSWYDLTCDDFIGTDASLTVWDIFPVIDIDIAYKFSLNGETVETAGVRGTYTILAQEPTAFEFSGNDNYKVTEIIVVNEGVLTISGGDSLKLAEDSTLAYMYLHDEDDMIYRSYYSDEEWTHGKDDLEFNKVVLGNIPLMTSVGKFLNGLDPNQLDKIRIYDQYGDLVFDLGHAAEGIEELELYDADSYAVGTGWKVTYGLDEDAADVVYLSVLGDMDGDGAATSTDMTIMGRFIKGESSLSEEVLLAALVCNFGEVSADDISYLGCIIRNEISSKELF